MSTKLKYLTISQSERAEDSSLYVINRTKPRGNINLVVGNNYGTRDAVRIPISRVPLDLTTQAVKANILQSPEFRRSVAKGSIMIISTDSAEELFAEDPAAQKEREELFDSIQTTGVSVEESQEAPEMTLADQVALETGGEIASESSSVQIEPFFVNLVMRAQPESLESNSGDTLDGIIQEMNSRADMLDEPTLNYIISNCQQPAMAEAASLLLQEL